MHPTFSVAMFTRMDDCYPLGDTVFLPQVQIPRPGYRSKLTVLAREVETWIPDSSIIVGVVPFAGFGYLITEDGFTDRVYNSFGLGRLENIGQLGRLYDHAEWNHKGVDWSLLRSTFTHNRWQHSLDARQFANLIATNLRLDSKQILELEFGMLTHDCKTPAFGDGVKCLAPELFDEDRHYPEIFETPEAQEFLAEYQIDRDRVIGLVQYETGLLGQIRDFADKLAYLCRDVNALTTRIIPELPIGYPAGYRRIAQLAAAREHPFGIWETVQSQNGQMYIADPEWLRDVLLLRALMFQNVYMFGPSKLLEHLTSTVFVQTLFDEGKLKPEQLLSFDDPRLEMFIQNEFGREASPLRLGPMFNFPQRIETFPDMPSAQRRQRELAQSGIALTFLDSQPAPKPATHLQVRCGRKIGRFDQLCPEFAAEISAIMQAIPTVKLYYADVPYQKLPDYYQRVSRAVRRRVLALKN